MKKYCFLLTAVLMSMQGFAEETEETFLPLEPMYIGTYGGGADWGANWFLSAQGGVNAFVGSPKGCGDLFDRIMPDMNFGIGKWFDSAWGARLSYQGQTLKDSRFEEARYENYHADLMCNLTSCLNLDSRGIPAWDCIPYVGLGLINNEETGSHPFAFSYGLIGRYHLGGRLHLMVELGGTTTFKDFDGDGDGDAIGDNLLNLTAGLSLTIGKNGWRRITDAEPYIAQNEAMRRYIEDMRDGRNKDRRTIAELRKILELEGLLEKYEGNLEAASAATAAEARNSYSGLNSLRQRMADRRNGKSDDGGLGDGEYAELFGDGVDDGGVIAGGNDSVGDGGERILSVPVFFFFKLNTSELTDQSQLVNLKEIARIAGKYGLAINVSGAADSATGTEEINDRLSRERTEYIVERLKELGVAEDALVRHAEGGVSRYGKAEANRNSVVNLMLRK